jgi:hypothetical protein
MLLWTWLRHLSHIDRKQEAKSSVGKAAAGGTGRFDGLGCQRLNPSHNSHCLLSIG